MSIQKKSLISALKTTKKANIASTPVEGEKAVSSKAFHTKGLEASAQGPKLQGAKHEVLEREEHKRQGGSLVKLANAVT